MDPGATKALVGTTVNRFVVVQEVGPYRGGVEYRAMDPEQNSRLVAVLVVRLSGADIAVGGTVTNPFIREVRLASELRHPQVAEVFGTGQLDADHWWLAGEILDGMSLEEELGHKGSFPWDEATDLIGLAAAAVGVLHDKQVVHRNLSPACVVSRVSKAGKLKVKVSRYGLAKYAHERDDLDAGVPPLAISPPHYMAPETAMGRGTGYRSDVWALAAMAHELITGEPIVPARMTPEELVRYLASGEPTPPWELQERCPTLPPLVAEFLTGCLARDPRDRPRDAVTFGAGLKRAVEEAAEETAGADDGGLLGAVGSLFRRRSG